MHRALDYPADEYSKSELFTLLNERECRAKQRESTSRDRQHGGLPSWIVAIRRINRGVLYEPARQIVESNKPFNPVGIGNFSCIGAVAHILVSCRCIIVGFANAAL
ncbi:hypothetical protein LZK82_26905 (plasmid) [Rhizobium leguminosarum]|uniref:Uncharacterized protein n=1 Tax=Neorhizobium galegae TaxID=399 RepID=A0A6A1THS5_NEOGA|nr:MULTISPECIES: hypothetical protein [Rhizobium/Agrobacterium group]KAB1082383.1 hypothetical protein F4V91_32575 [Neorhizobium galegae]UIK01162.1 hypothetical protein LZK82_26905 [Rhizobium leguminosarum]UIK14081.1 hypothetical protein LZK80_32540 [Rhizobium leguminosarum]UIL30215.1 hypothetical protein LZK75_27245 [Rhizobium leguminosarum]WFT89478.1 hypothetical protein QA638_26970 [Rhizobium leguminosarum]